MRTLSTASKLLAFVAAALGVVAALGMPWFGDAPERAQSGGPPTLEGPTAAFFGGLWRSVSAVEGATAYEHFATLDTVLLGIVALGVVGALLGAIGGIERIGRRLMQTAALGVVGVVSYELIRVGIASDPIEARRGAVVAFACGGVMLITASSVAQQKLRRQPPPSMTALHDPSLARPRSVAPPGR